MAIKQITQKSKVRRRPARRQASRRTMPVRKSGPRGALKATALGVASEHLVSSAPMRTIQSQAPANSFPRPPLSSVTEPVVVPSISRFSRTLIAPRASFWLGFGLGMLVVGGLMVITWYLLRVELVEEIVIALTRP